MDLFERIPTLEGTRVLLREIVDTDASAFHELAQSEAVYRYEPTYLYERRYDDARYAIAHLRSECLDTRESVLFAVCLRERPHEMLGIAEIYDYRPGEGAASIGGRLLERAWRQGISSEVAHLLTRYLIDEVGVQVVVTHVMADNVASNAMMRKIGFRSERSGFYEDWGSGKVLVNEYVFKRERE